MYSSLWHRIRKEVTPMIRRTALTILLVLIATAPLEAGRYIQRGPAVIGARGRRSCRYLALPQYWRNDKLEVYRKYGFPVHRIRERGYGRVLEHWKYYEHGIEFIFDEDHEIVETRRFWPEDRREGISPYRNEDFRTPRTVY